MYGLLYGTVIFLIPVPVCDVLADIAVLVVINTAFFVGCRQPSYHIIGAPARVGNAVAICLSQQSRQRALRSKTRRDSVISDSKYDDDVAQTG